MYHTLVVCLAALVASSIPTSALFAQEIIEEGTSGSMVVEHVVDVIGGTCILDNELFLRRMAYVETNDGTATSTYRDGYHGGIWNIDEAMFNATKNSPWLLPTYEILNETLNIDWTKVTWKDLRKPINSGLAAALYLLSKNIKYIPESLEVQSTIWSTIRSGMSATQFYFKAVNLDMSCPNNKEIDLAIILEFKNISTLEMVNVQTFLSTLLKTLPLDLDATRVGLVTKKVRPMVGWFLNSQTTGITILTVLNALFYTKGPTTTGDSLKYTRQMIFNQENGARPDAAKVALLLTDVITDYDYALSEVHEMQKQGISLLVVEMDADGNSTNRKDLNRLVSEPKCRHARIVQGFQALESVTGEVQVSICNAPTILNDGDHVYPCNTTLVAKLADTSLSVSVKVTSSNDDFVLYGARSYTRPDETSYDVLMTSNSTSSRVLFVRGTDPMYIHVRAQNSTCTGTFTVHMISGSLMDGVTDGVCVIAGVVRDCTQLDMNTALHDVILVRGSPMYLCDHRNHSIEIYPHPLDNNKFYMCDQHEESFTGLCPVNQSKCTQFTSGCKYTNPCTSATLASGQLFHNDPCGTNDTYFRCSQMGMAEEYRCPVNRLWNKDTGVCVFEFVHDVRNGTDDKNIPNPCIHSHEDHVYFPHPTFPTKYILCDVHGNAFVNECKEGLWNQQTMTCTMLSPNVG